APNLAGMMALSRARRRLRGCGAAKRAYVAGSSIPGGTPMTIKVGDKLPNVTLTQATAEGPKPVSTEEFFKGKRVALFAVPGAFTPTCSAKHLPGFKQKASEIRSKGVDVIACVA